MSEIAISVQNLSKHYRLGAGPAGRGDFRDAVAAAVGRVKRRFAGGNDGADSAEGARDLWALRDVSFEVKKGEVVGLIGQNGAGKSTLLKILSRITDPTSGEAWFEGRVGSLLEVGTGFHPELSGRENIYLSGAILGMRREEISAKFDEIVEFSEIGRFLDTPVKRYSSGMYVRLGFAVAAHLEPEVLIVDEVLAVGDATFQRKCMGKMKDVAQTGRTILFVSHNMGSIQALCDRAVVLSGGRSIGQGRPEEAVKLYLQSTAEHRSQDLAKRTDRTGRGRTRLIRAVAYSQGHEDASGLLMYGQTAWIQFDVNESLPNLVCKFTIYDNLSRPVCRFTSNVRAPDDRTEKGRRFTCEIPEMPLVPGSYDVNVAIFSGPELEDRVEAAVSFEVEFGLLAGRTLDAGHRAAAFAPRHRWTVPVTGG